jgi:hypothetical protein
MSSDLVNGNKEKLLGEFRVLKEVHGRRWRSKLMDFDPWHNTSEGIYAWQNTVGGKAGNEALRRIIDDMRAIIAAENPAAVKISTEQFQKIRKQSIQVGLKSLKSKSPKKSAELQKQSA